MSLLGVQGDNEILYLGYVSRQFNVYRSNAHLVTPEHHVPCFVFCAVPCREELLHRHVSDQIDGIERCH